MQQNIVLNLDLKSDLTGLSYQSNSAICLLKYCGIQYNLKCVCYHSAQLLQEHIDFLNVRYNKEKLLFVTEDYNGQSSEFILIYLKNKDNPECLIVSEASLPSLIRYDTQNCILVIAGLASVYREIVKMTKTTRPSFHTSSLLGFRNNCLKACSGVSRWTYLCEIMSINVLENGDRLAEEFVKREFFDPIETTLKEPLKLAHQSKKKQRERNKFIEEDKRFLEDYFITISDLLLFYFVHHIVESYEHLRRLIETKYQRICEWYEQMSSDESVKRAFITDQVVGLLKKCSIDCSDEATPSQIEETSISDEISIDMLAYKIQLSVKSNYSINVPMSCDEANRFVYDDIKLDWLKIDSLANPSAGSLPTDRINRKCQQLENFYHVIKKLVCNKDKPLTIVDFCSGGGHLAIFLAYMFPNCLIKLVENKEESLDFALKRISQLKLTNCVVFKGNLNNFLGRFDLGVALHSCGSLADLIIEKCIQSSADLVIAPCCYGSIKPVCGLSNQTRISYPRSQAFRSAFDHYNSEESSMSSAENSSLYFILTNYADRTEKNLIDEANGHLSMSLIDSDRLLYLKERLGYERLELYQMQPEDCSTKNNLIVAIGPSKSI